MAIAATISACTSLPSPEAMRATAPSSSSPRARWRTATAALLAAWSLVLAGCGGGDASEDNEPASGGDDRATIEADAGIAASAATRLSRKLATCPFADTLIDTPVACMVGIWEGRTTDGEDASCAMHYRADGDVYYTAGGTSHRFELGLTSNASVYAKRRARTPSGFTISHSIAIGSQGATLYYQNADHPQSAAALLFQPDSVALPGCRFTSPPAPAPTGAASTRNFTGRSWLRPTRLDDGNLVSTLSDQPGFDAGMADDGRAYITYRTNVDGRLAVAVVEGRPGAEGRAARWSDPVVLDAVAPILNDNVRPRLAVSPNGHAVISWVALLPCGSDSYEEEPSGKQCRYLMATRRLANDATWEPVKRVRATSRDGDPDQAPHINRRGDVVILYRTFEAARFPTPYSALAYRIAAAAEFRTTWLTAWSWYASDLGPLSRQIGVDLDDRGNVTVAGMSASYTGGVRYARGTLTALPARWDTASEDGGSNFTDDVVRGGDLGFLGARYIRQPFPRMPATFTAYSTASSHWLAPMDVTAQVMWGDSRLVGTDRTGGELLLYSGCRVTSWRHDQWGSTRKLPAYCGLDRNAGVYAFNRKGDYIGLNWAGHRGQWGVYRRSDNSLRKGPPGSGTTRARDFLLGTRSSAFADDTTQLFLSPDGLALAVTTNDYTRLPSASDPRGKRSGAAGKLWATFLK